MHPLISVIIPAFNSAESITDSIGSILTQSSYAQETEIIVIDDESTDNTRELVRKLATQHPAIKLFDNVRTKGPSGARNVGLMNARGNYIAFLDADDKWYPDHLQKAISFLDRYKDVDVVFYNFDIHELNTNRVIEDWFTQRNYPRALMLEKMDDEYYLIRDDMINALFEESFLHLQSMVIKRKAVDGVLFNETVLRSGDRDFAISLADKSSARYAFGDVKTSVWFRHDNSLTTNSSDSFVAMALDHITFYREYLSRYSDRPNSAPILKKILLENYLDVSFHFRHKNQLMLSLQYLVNSVKYGFDIIQVKQLVKIAGAFLIYKVLQRRLPVQSDGAN